MSRKVKCQDTGEYSTSDKAWRSPKGKYYSSEEAYNAIQTNLTNKALCIDKIKDILRYKDFMKLPTLFYKKLSEWEPFGYDVVLTTMNNKHDDMCWALNNKQFTSESGKLMYLCTIIENNLVDAYKEKVAQNKVVNHLSDITEDVAITNQKQATRDISKWLEE